MEVPGEEAHGTVEASEEATGNPEPIRSRTNKKHRCAHALCCRDGGPQVVIPLAGVRLARKKSIPLTVTAAERETNLRRLERDEDWLRQNLNTKQVRICNVHANITTDAQGCRVFEVYPVPQDPQFLEWARKDEPERSNPQANPFVKIEMAMAAARKYKTRLGSDGTILGALIYVR